MSKDLVTASRYQEVKGDEIRLLTLEASLDFYDKIVCTCYTTKLVDSTFEALSYAWGCQSITRVISFNGLAISISATLDCALRYLRLTRKPRTLWVDGLCIDQSNAAEKESQIRLMPEIYRQSHRCLIWLGEASRHTQKLFRAASLCRLLPDSSLVLFELQWKIKTLLQKIGKL